MTKKIIAAIFLLAIIAIGIYFFFSKKSEKSLLIDVSEVAKTVQIKHFDDAFFTTDTLNFEADLAKLRVDFAPFFSSNADAQFWFNSRKEKNQINLYADWKKQMPSPEPLDQELHDAFKHLYFYYPELPEFTAFTYISNLDFDYPVLVADNFVFLATDMYLGKNHPAYQHQGTYLNYYRQADFITTDAMEQFAISYAAKDLNDNTLLNEMIWWGKVVYFREAMQPEANDTILARISSVQQNFCVLNEVNMWTYFIDNKLLFETNDQIKRKFIAPAPFSKFGMPFDAETPGMVGRWLGWRIVSSYMANNPNVSLQELMANNNSKLIFKNSKYKP